MHLTVYMIIHSGWIHDGKVKFEVERPVDMILYHIHQTV